jgi:hypothetical protein
MGAVSCKKEVRINRICGTCGDTVLMLLLSFSEEEEDDDGSEHNIVKAFCIF